MDIDIHCEVLSVAACATYIGSTAAKDQVIDGFSFYTGLLPGEWSRPSVSWTTGWEINGTETCGLARTGWVLP